MYCSASHAGEHGSIALDLTPPLFYFERAKHVYSTECEWCSLSNSTIGEVCHLLFNQSSMQPAALYTMEVHLLDCCIPTYHPVTTASFSVSPLPTCAHFKWHHYIMCSVTLSSFGNSTGCLQASFKYDLCKLPLA